MIRRLLAWFGAAVFAICGVLGLWTAGTFAQLIYSAIQFTMRQSGSGGLGAVSVGFAEGIGWEFAAVLPSALFNRALARRARGARGLFASLHRTQSMLLLAVAALILVLIVVAFAGLSGLAPFITIMFLILLSVALQCLALGGMLAILARS